MYTAYLPAWQFCTLDFVPTERNQRKSFRRSPNKTQEPGSSANLMAQTLKLAACRQDSRLSEFSKPRRRYFWCRWRGYAISPTPSSPPWGPHHGCGGSERRPAQASSSRHRTQVPTCHGGCERRQRLVKSHKIWKTGWYAPRAAQQQGSGALKTLSVFQKPKRGSEEKQRSRWGESEIEPSWPLGHLTGVPVPPEGALRWAAGPLRSSLPAAARQPQAASHGTAGSTPGPGECPGLRRWRRRETDAPQRHLPSCGPAAGNASTRPLAPPTAAAAAAAALGGSSGDPARRGERGLNSYI